MAQKNKQLVLALFDNEQAAKQAADALKQWDKANKEVKAGAVGVLVKDDKGKVKQELLGPRAWGKGAGIGAILGIVAAIPTGGLSLLPGVLGGAVGGGIVGGFFHKHLGMSKDDLDRIGKEIDGGKAAVGVLVEDNEAAAFTAKLQELGGKSETHEVTEQGAEKTAVAATLAEAGAAPPPAAPPGLDRTKLPIPDPVFKGKLGKTIDKCQPDWGLISDVKPPEGAPNVLLVLVDDAGFGNPSTFGGPVNTPNYTKLAEEGLRYNRHHVVALCSPTRAALLSSRNHHAVGFGSIGELAGPYPGYSAVRPLDCAPFPQVLQMNGYSTAAFGKMHITPDHVQGPAGPFERWPNGWGFEYFWGFVGGEAGQYDTNIDSNNLTLGAHGGPEDREFYFPNAMADNAIKWIHGFNAHNPDKPWFIYYSTGCSHAPHHVPAEWSDKYKGKFDMGWDKYREETFERQKKLGVVPQDAVLTPRPEELPAWDSLSDDDKKFYARQMEVYAGYQENCDWNIGRVIGELERMGIRDNTLIIWIWGDNGASMEGTITGSFNEFTMQNGIGLTTEQQRGLLQMYGGLEAWGGPALAPHYSAAWAWAGNCPFQWGKQIASHLGGTRDPMVVSWPNGIKERGGLRSQFTHVIDVGPTILDIVGLPQPTHVNGIQQEPMHGVSFKESLNDATSPEKHTQQYFEIFGNRAMYKDGWWAASRLPRIPWDATPPTMKKFAPGVLDPDTLEWELYNLNEDFTQANNLAAQNPDKVKELNDLWWAEADKYNVLPLLGGMAAFFGVVPPLGTRHTYTFWGSDVQNLHQGAAPQYKNRSYSITADLEVPAGGAEGVIAANVDALGGWSLFVQDGKLRHTYSFMGVQVYKQVSTEDVPTGKVQVKMDFEADKPVMAPGGTVRLYINDKEVGEGKMEHTVPLVFTAHSGLDIGCDNGEVVDREYEAQAPFAFTGKIEKVVFDVRPPGTAQDLKETHHAEVAAQSLKSADT